MSAVAIGMLTPLVTALVIFIAAWRSHCLEIRERIRQAADRDAAIEQIEWDLNTIEAYHVLVDAGCSPDIAIGYDTLEEA